MYSVQFTHDYEDVIWFRDFLPNALAEMVIWIYENKYITFNNGN